MKTREQHIRTTGLIHTLLWLALLLVPSIGQCFYNPSTGRWLSRDPYREQGFEAARRKLPRQGILSLLVAESASPNLYSLLRNMPVSEVEYLGLCGGGEGQGDCKCGDDVTFAIALTEMDVDHVYSSAPYLSKVAANFNMFTFPFSFTSWDITWLLGYPAPINNPSCSNCDLTVTFAGRCVATKDLNYLLFGWGMQLTRKEPDMLDYLWIGLWWRGWDDLASVDRKVAAADFGYSGNSEALDRMRWPDNCSPSKKVGIPINGVTTWRWRGLRWN